MAFNGKYVLHAGFWVLVGYVLAPEIMKIPLINRLPQF